MKKNIILVTVILFGVLFHGYFLHLNEVLKNADGFAYLQMTHFFNEFSIKGLGTGWFGFLYSLILAPFTFFFSDDFMVGKIVNLGLFAFSTYLLYKISSKFLPFKYCVGILLLFITSPTLLNYNIDILSENLYIPLFLLFIISNLKLLKNFSYKNVIITSLLIALMYFTRGEAFIYILGTGLLLTISLLQKKLTFPQFFKKSLTLLGAFLIFVSPYIFYMWTFTGEIGLTNKGASNFRQAQMRGIYTQDDEGFERAVGELTLDKKHLIAGFAGGLDYDKPSIKGGGVVSLILNEPKETFSRWLTNQKKLYSQSIPHILIGNGVRYGLDKNGILDRIGFGSKYLFFGLILITILISVYGFIKVLLSKNKSFPMTVFAMYFIASTFFTIFFIIERYFILFVPFFFVFFAFGLYFLPKKHAFFKKIIVFLAFSFLIFVNLLGIIRYQNFREPLDNYYSLKMQAGQYIADIEGNKRDLKVMERFPIVTYYSGTKIRILTPYVEKLDDLLAYASHKDVDYLVVDTMDFEKYRPALKSLLDENITHKGFELFKVFEEENAKVMLYKLYK